AGQDSGKAERHRGLTGRQPLVHDEHAIVGDVEGESARMPGTTARSTVDPLSEPVSISTPQPLTDGGPKKTRAPDLLRCPVSVSVPRPTRAFAAKPLPMISSVKALDPTLADDGESEKILRTLHGPTSTEAE